MLTQLVVDRASHDPLAPWWCAVLVLLALVVLLYQKISGLRHP